jgi:hypothetical protein
MLQRIRESRTTKLVSVYLVMNILAEIFVPTAALALTSGPGQPESSNFTQVGTAEMVDKFTGDFNYNIPLMDVGGYPINIAYTGGITMDQEASWVGLGWNINPGVINRGMRSVPDDFDGEEVKTEFNSKSNQTFGINAPIGLELFGANVKWVKLSLGLNYNNYKGFGLKVGANLSLSAGEPSKGALTGGLGLSAGTDGVDVSPSLSFEKKGKDKQGNENKLGLNVGSSFNSRAGLGALTMGASYSGAKTRTTTDPKTNEVTSTTTSSFSGSVGGAAISFSSPSYTPQYTMPMFNANVSFGLTLAGALFGTHPNIELNGFYSGQYLKHKSASVPAFGYLYTQNGVDASKVMHDLNREKDGAFTEHTPSLPLTNYSYDILSVSGQGVGGMYRPFRNDVGMLFDSEVTSDGGSLDVPGLEIGVGWNVHGGADVNGNYTNTKSGKWSKQKFFGFTFDNNNPMEDVMKFKGDKGNESPLYETYYYKQAGEKTIDEDEAFFDKIGGEQAVKIGLDLNHSDVPTTKQLISDHGFVSNFTNNQKSLDNKRQPRNQEINILNGEQASNYGVSRTILEYPINNFNLKEDGTYQNSDGTSRVNYSTNINSKKHMSEISTLRTDGARYVYGIPAYNTKQIESSFAVSENSQGNSSTGLVTYTEEEDSKDNNSGLDNFYTKTEMPAYAHSYLLTEVLSADYVDRDNVAGPSDGDYGNYTKIDYTRIKDYKWRTPFEHANYNEGFKSDKYDNKGSYIYGEKDVWYMHSVVTKTHVAEFVLEDRDDSYGVQGQRGGGYGKGLKRLKEIRLYAKQDKIKNGVNATPIKVVHFEYSYELCPGIHNNIRKLGKLTLKKIWFSYGKSNKGKLSAYKFNYADTNHDGIVDANPSYNIKGYDRWGNYKENKGTVAGSPTEPASTSDFPYVEQDRSITDLNAASWSMTSIELPSGGKIKIDFEADDYAFVQNKRAMQMFNIAGTGKSPNDNINNDELYDLGQANKVIFFKLQNPIDISRSEQDVKNMIKNQYLTDQDGNFIDQMYFRFLVDLGGLNNKVTEFLDGKLYDFVPGYTRINSNSFGVAKHPNTIKNGKYEFGYIEVNTPESILGIGEINPIAKAAWNFTKLYRPTIAYNTPSATDNGIVQVCKAILSVSGSIIQMFEGMDLNMWKRQCSKKFSLDKSYIRLYSPENKKLGGGIRVKKIRMSDEWQVMGGGNKTSEYGQEYDYTTTDANGNTISSGVASYEPALGGDENPFKQPDFYTEEKVLAPDDSFYKEHPYGESFFPSPSVGYSRITVKNIQYANVKRNATGKVVHEYYTAKDFPTIVDKTTLTPDRKKPPFVFKLLKIGVNDHMTASQGFSIILNDMHGKEKSNSVYQEGKSDPISRVRYFYKTRNEYSELMVNRLDNEVLVLHKNPTENEKSHIEKRRIGVEYDFVADSRRSETKTYSGSLKGNLEAFLVFAFPITAPVFFPAFSKEEVGFKSISTTKVINQYGLLEKVVAEDLGSSVSTKNLAYDALTGEVLVTETANQFDDPVYSFNYPAHWGYDLMGHSYKNIGINLKGVDLTNLSNATTYFAKGDEVYMNGQLGWVYEVNSKGNGVGIKVMDVEGNDITSSNANIVVIRSGRRNQQSTSIGQVTSKTNPLNSNFGNVLKNIVFDKVINASAVEFTDKGKVYCECGLNPNTNTKVNPYKEGLAGIWRPLRSHLFLTDRIQTRDKDNTNIRKDGIYSTFTPFWMSPLSSKPLNYWTAPQAPATNNWTWTSEVTVYSPYGVELENRDALNRYSSATYGYHNALPTSVATNAKYEEVAFDNFEDYDFGGCNEHFNYKAQKGFVKEKTSHTGKRSISVPAKGKHSLTKVLVECK